MAASKGKVILGAYFDESYGKERLLYRWIYSDDFTMERI
jgi:hypothetical protein